MSSILPRLDDSNLDYRAQLVNSYLRDICKKRNIGFINNYTTFINKEYSKVRQELYAKDGLHLNNHGMAVFAMNIRRFIKGSNNVTSQNFR